MELKTLKDIEKIDMKERAFANSIRKEAIKWVKWKLESSDLKIEKMNWENNKLIISWKGTDKFSAGFIQGIAELHNITEEDLK